MNFSTNLRAFWLTLFLVATPAITHADVIYPALDVMNFPSQGDTGADLVVGNYLDVDSTAFRIVYDDNITPSTPIPLTDFDLTSTFSAGFYSGSFSAGTLVSGSFSNLELTFTGGGILGSPMTYTYTADVIFNGGSLVSNGQLGSMTGSVYSDGTYIAKIGQVVVPVPAAVWLFASGLIGLVGIGRRNSA